MTITRRLSAAASALLIAWARAAAAQVPAGPEFRVNTYTPSNQEGYRQFLAVAPGGDFVVTWEDMGGHDGDRNGVFAQRYSAAGTPLGPELRVNSYTTGIQTGGAVAMDGRGRFVIVWAGDIGDGTFDVLARRYDAAGAPLGAEFRVNDFTTGEQYNPTVAADAAGSFVVVWSDSSGRDGDGRAPFGRRFQASGAPIGGDFQINTTTTGGQWAPAVDCDAAGGFVVAWGSSGQDGSSEGVFAQRFDAGGLRLGGELQVNTYTTGFQTASRVAIGAAGEFVIAWFGAGPGDDNGAFLRRYDAAGVAQGAEFRVNTNTVLSQARPAVDYDAAGNPVVTWYDTFADGPFDTGILGQRFNPDWSRRGAEFRVNTYTTGTQHTPALGVDRAGNFRIAWTSQNQDGAGDGLYAQRFGGLFPSALSVDTPGGGGGGDKNRVLEPGEAVDVRPSWRNASGAAQSFAGVLANITGPAGPSYAIGDGSADYGTAADGALQPCADCYAVTVSNPGVRPAVHWDATVDERITPDVQGQHKRWTLHVGRSFDDVATASPFYRFVETLLHHGVTGGCGGGQYCPASATTREQMAVFVLIAREGAGYTPADCGAPLFADVPASSPFCRFIEELARRGVVSGCGSGSYCPAGAVTREQMAVFVLRTLDPALSPPACATPVFADVPASSPFCRWIEELARRGVVTGCGSGNYCPAAAVTREQMGVFISATFGLTLYGA